MQNVADRIKFVLREADKGNYDKACDVNRETKLLKIRDSKKELPTAPIQKG